MKKLNQLFAIILALTLTVSMSACSSVDDTSSDTGSTEYVTQYVDEDGNIIQVDENGNPITGDRETSGDAGTGSNSGNNGGNGGSSGGNGGSNGGNGGSGGTDASKYEGTTVTFATWKDPNLNEDKVAVDSFKKKYGIKVKIDMIDEEEYVNTLVGRIAAGNSPDVVFCNGTFPGVLQVLQPIDAAKLDLTDDIWDQAFIKQAAVNGKKYLVNTIGNIWNEYDCLFYNKTILKKAGCYTPEEYDKQGKWTWDALEQIMKQVDALGGRYVGGAISPETIAPSVGAQPIKYENGKFTGNINAHTTEVYTRIAEWYDQGLASTGAYEFVQGNAGICPTNAFGLKKTGYFAKSNHSEIAAYYLPDYNSSIKSQPTGLFRGWGIAKGAKNPEAAGIFIRHYLDVDNYDTDKAFINSEAERFFFMLTTGDSENKKYYFHSEQFDAVSGYDAFTKFSINGIVSNKPEQVAGLMEAEKNALNNGVNNLNSFISKY